MKKIVCLLVMAGMILSINSCREDVIQGELDGSFKSGEEKDDKYIENALNWYDASPDENSYPLLENAEDLKWNKAIVHNVDTEVVVEVPIKLKKQYGLRVKDDEKLNVEQRLLLVNKDGTYSSLLEFIISEKSKNELEDPTKGKLHQQGKQF